MNNETDSRTQAYADDTAVQAKDLKGVQREFDKLSLLFKQHDLQINPRKCELLGDCFDSIIHSLSGTIITDTPLMKYLGLHLDANAKPQKLKTSDLGRYITTVTPLRTIDTYSRIKLFHIYSKSRINHTFPHRTLTDNSRDLWKTLRSVIFKFVLRRIQIPIEAMSPLKLDFYHILIRPLLHSRTKLEDSADEDLLIYMDKAILKLLITWLDVETKQSDDYKIFILE